MSNYLEIMILLMLKFLIGLHLSFLQKNIEKKIYNRCINEESERLVKCLKNLQITNKLYEITI